MTAFLRDPQHAVAAAIVLVAVVWLVVGCWREARR